MILPAQFQYNGWLAGGCNGTTVDGGGNYGHVGGDSSNIQILGASSIHGNVYGGGNMGRIVGNTHVIIGDYPPLQQHQQTTTAARVDRTFTPLPPTFPLDTP